MLWTWEEIDRLGFPEAELEPREDQEVRDEDEYEDPDHDNEGFDD